MPAQPLQTSPWPDDIELVQRIASRDEGAFEMLMRRYNRKLFRVARAILKDDAEAEEALQDAYLAVYVHIGEFQGRARLSTWITRIVINQALMRSRKQRRDRVIVPLPTALGSVQPAELAFDVPASGQESPESATMRAEIRHLLEAQIDRLPVAFRAVFILREVEDLSVSETAECLGIPEATVRTRLFRAKALLREALAREIDLAAANVFGFAGERCDRIVAAVRARLRELDPS